MPNDANPWPVKAKFAEGAPLSAEQLTRIVDALTRRIVGDGKTIQVSSFPGGQICIKGIGTKAGGAKAASSTSSNTTGRFVIPGVLELPAVPTQSNIWQVVFWKSTDGGSGDDQPWWTYTGLTRWYPLTYSSLDGTPGDTEYGAP